MSILTDLDRPELGGSRTVLPPGTSDPVKNAPLSGGADYMFDVSRRMRVKITSPVATDWYTDPGGPIFDSLPAIAQIQVDYPTNDVIGNDDSDTLDEINMPDSSGTFLSFDKVGAGEPLIRDAGGAIGDAVELRWQFGEFLRLEIAGTWTRISDFVDWRVHMLLRKVDEAADGVDYNGDGDMLDQIWIDDGSISDQTNNGW